MKICQVERPLVATNRIAMMEHKHLQVVIDGSSKLVAVDAVGAKPGDWVICVGSSAAREAAGSKGYPSDLTIVGIIDHWPPAGESGEGGTPATGADGQGAGPGATDERSGGAT
jgi:ethanolamine utilization protein EutN